MNAAWRTLTGLLAWFPGRLTASTDRPAAWRTLAGLAIFVAALALAYAAARPPPPQPWTEAELQIIGSLWLGALPPAPKDPSNAVVDLPLAQRLGHRLFFDARLSANNAVSCATCHRPERRFTDGLPLAVGLGVGQFNTPSLIGVAYSPWQFWNGRKDSLWAQATAPLESPIEHGTSRTAIARLIAADSEYRTAYAALFGPLPELPEGKPDSAADDQTAAEMFVDAAKNPAVLDTGKDMRQAVTEVFVNAAKAIAAYQRLLLPGESRFDRYAAGLVKRNAGELSADRQDHGNAISAANAADRGGAEPGTGSQDPADPRPDASLTRTELEGLRLFIGKAQCVNCHNGPLFTNHEFHNTGPLPAPGGLPDLGRIVGADLVRNDPFNCLGRHSDAAPNDCAELRFMRTGPELLGARKTPSLRNLEGTEPHMHAGQIASLAEVLDHYNRAPDAIVGHSEAKPLNLLPYELKRLQAFLHSLDAPPATAPEWLAPP